MLDGPEKEKALTQLIKAEGLLKEKQAALDKLRAYRDSPTRSKAVAGQQFANESSETSDSDLVNTHTLTPLTPIRGSRMGQRVFT